MAVLATCLGYPRIGITRKLKKALESFWAAKSTAGDLHRIAAEMRIRHWGAMKQAGIDQIPVGDFSLYDHLLDMALARTMSRGLDLEYPSAVKTLITTDTSQTED